VYAAVLLRQMILQGAKVDFDVAADHSNLCYFQGKQGPCLPPQIGLRRAFSLNFEAFQAVAYTFKMV
jgi:hypothetical protein